MGVRERKVETKLNAEVKKLGGLTRKWTGFEGVPDRIVAVKGIVWFVEVKTTDGTLSPIQIREHKRLDAVGANVTTVYGETGVMEFIETLKGMI